MSGISTKGVKKSFISKELKPGNFVAKINNISIETVKEPRDPSVPEYKIWLELESKPIGGDFVGYDKVFGDPSKGQYLGQTKKIQHSSWPIKTYSGISKKTNEPYEFEDSQQILEFLQKLLTVVGKPDWLEENDGKFQTWSELFAGIVRSKALKDIYLSWCVGGQESVNQKNFTIYYMHLPDRRDAPEPFALEGGLVTKFNPDIHVTKSNKITQENAALNNGTDEISDDDISDEDLFNTDDDDELFDMDMDDSI